jgi:hypothetical protein
VHCHRFGPSPRPATLILVAEDKVTVREAASLLGMSVKAVQQAIHREAFPNIERDVDPETKRTLRVWIPRRDLERYAERRRIQLADIGSGQDVLPVPRSTPETWRRVAEGLQQDNLDLRLRVAELENEVIQLRQAMGKL